MKVRYVYLDVCALCRPFDDQGYARIRLETDAVNLILAKVRDGKYRLAVSRVHSKEIAAISDSYERLELVSMVETFGEPVKSDPSATRSRAEELCALGFGVADAAHVAFAEQSGADFITCDDKLLKQCQRSNIGTWCGDPVLFCVKENLK
jgi:predicted nucleic acid-binding protein